MENPGSSAGKWNQVAREWLQNGYSNRLLAEHGKKSHLALIAKWVDVKSAGRILKTDLFDVAFGPAPFMFDLAQSNGNIIGIDISNEVVVKAKQQSSRRGIDTGTYICCDVRQIPLRDNSVDLVISDSTLDHFSAEKDICSALNELRRILRAGGILILSIDNSSNLTYPPYMLIRLWMRLGLSPYFIGRTLSPRRLEQTLENTGFTVEDKTAIFHSPHPDVLVRSVEGFLSRLGRGRFDSFIRKSLNFFDKLENRRTKYLTGRYIAIKAVKNE